MHGQRVRLARLVVMVLLVLLSSVSTARAASGDVAYTAGQAHYKSGQYAAAAASYEQAIDQGHRTPGTYYQLGLCFSRLKRWNDAVWAYQTALRLDPSFASAHPTLTTKLRQAQAHGGTNQGPPQGVTTGTGSSTGGASSGSGRAPSAPAIAAALQSGAVYVDPAMAGSVGSVSSLESTAASLQASSNTRVRFAFVHAIPGSYATLGQYTYDLFDRLGLTRAVVVVAGPHGVAARTDRLSTAETQALTNASRAQFVQGSYVLGADSLARAIVKKADDEESASSRNRAVTIIVIVLIVLAAIGLFALVRISRWRRRYREAVTWRDQLADLVTSTGNHVDALPEDHPAKRTFLDASAYYATASKIVDDLAKTTSLQAVLGGGHMRALGQARSQLQAAERALQQAEAQSGGRPATGVAQPAPGGEVIPPAQFLDRASGERAVAACFFCAKPLDPATAQVVEVPAGNGATRRVMACDEHAADVRAGRQPQIRAVPNPAQGGRLEPWWAVPSYDPRRDYVYDPYYYRGGGIGWGDLLLYDALFDRPYGYNNVVFVDNDNNYPDAGYNQAGSYGYESNRPDTASFDAASSGPSAAETDFTMGGGDYGGDRS